MKGEGNRGGGSGKIPPLLLRCTAVLIHPCPWGWGCAWDWGCPKDGGRGAMDGDGGLDAVYTPTTPQGCGGSTAPPPPAPAPAPRHSAAAPNTGPLSGRGTCRDGVGGVAVGPGRQEGPEGTACRRTWGSQPPEGERLTADGCPPPPPEWQGTRRTSAAPDPDPLLQQQ